MSFENKNSTLRENPKSKVVKNGYINIYSDLTPQEQRGILYKEKYKKDHPQWDETQVFLSNMFDKLDLNEVVLLDAGCGHGNYVVDENRSKIKWAVGIDVSAESVSKNICLDEILISSLEEMPFSDHSFDVCVSLWVLEHLENPKKVFDEIYRVLKPGGYFMFATPNKDFLPLKIAGNRFVNKIFNRILFGRNEEDIFKTHYKANTIEDVSRLAEGRFELVHLKYNFDPSYFSYNDLYYCLNLLIKRIFDRFSTGHLPHLVGNFRKI